MGLKWYHKLIFRMVLRRLDKKDVINKLGGVATAVKFLDYLKKKCGEKELREIKKLMQGDLIKYLEGFIEHIKCNRSWEGE